MAWSPGVNALIHQAGKLRVDGLDLLFRRNRLDRQFAGRVKAAGLEIYVWTMDDPAEASRFVQARLNGITKNWGAWLKCNREPHSRLASGEVGIGDSHGSLIFL
jgi:glycerophosphoryl diester phosphodiesterase